MNLIWSLLGTQLAKAVARHALTLAGGWLVTRGYLSDSQWSEVGGAVMALLAVGHSLWDKRSSILAELKALASASPASTGPGAAAKLAALCLIPAALAGSGCTFARRTTTINTPAVFVTGTNASGIVTSNLVSAASVQTTVERDRIWLPHDYVVLHNSSMYGITIEATTSDTGTPKIRAGTATDSLLYIPASTRSLYAPNFTANGSINNKVPFVLSGMQAATAGNTQVQQVSTNGAAASTAGAK